MTIRPLFSAAEIRTRIDALAAELAPLYVGAPLTLVWIAEGARRFSHVLAERLAARGLEPELRCVRARRTQGRELLPVQLDAFDTQGLEGRNLLVLDDIADRGDTLRAVLAATESSGARSLRVAVLVDKITPGRQPVHLDHALFRVAEGWVVGFGMDLDGAYRELDEIGVVA